MREEKIKLLKDELFEINIDGMVYTFEALEENKPYTLQGLKDLNVKTLFKNENQSGHYVIWFENDFVLNALLKDKAINLTYSSKDIKKSFEINREYFVNALSYLQTVKNSEEKRIKRLKDFHEKRGTKSTAADLLESRLRKLDSRIVLIRELLEGNEWYV